MPRGHFFDGLMGQSFLALILPGLSKKFYNIATMMKIHVDIKHTASAQGQLHGRQQKECLTLREEYLVDGIPMHFSDTLVYQP